MAARCADKSVTDFAIVGAGDSIGVAEGGGVALGSAAIALALRATNAIKEAKVVAVLDLKHRI